MKSLKKIKFLFSVSMIAAVMIALSVGYFIGSNSNSQNAHFVNTEKGNISNVDFALFWEAYQKLKDQYIGEIDLKKYLYGAIEGGYASLGDPYTNFLDPEMAKEFNQELSGELEGIGLRLGVLDSYPTVISPIKNSPAEKAGLKPKDKILAVDSEDTKNVPIDVVVSKIKGPAGTKVKLLVLKNNSKDEKEVEIIREKISIETVETEYRDGLATVKISEFGTESTSEFDKAAQEISKKGINKLIIDLRGNVGGLLTGSIDLCGYLFENDTVVVQEESREGKTVHKTQGNGLLKNVDLIILTDQGTASASEIVAGAIKDHNRGKLVGEKTFGKGVVQSLSPLSEKSYAKITVAKWLTPKGNSIDKNGIDPDIEVKDENLTAFSESDKVLEKAIDLLK